jgi:aspartyl-tRNA(Asn)/glutamyl-tRNA(Gln) amidotransferase subunit A
MLALQTDRRIPMSFPSAVHTAAQIRADRQSASAAVGECLERIGRAQETLNAYVTVCRSEALERARQIDAQGAAGPLAGVPFSVKDNIETRGIRTTYGSRTLEQNVPDVEAVAVRRLREAGAVLVGKTTLPEFASTVFSRSPLTGLTRNPWNLAMTPGGSSSGAAAAVSAGLAPIALTTDAGASTRLPAACCGVLGLKPSIGLVPYELFPDGFSNFIHMGLITRTVADLALALDVVSGEDPADPQSVGVAPTRSLEGLKSPLGLRGTRLMWRPFLGNTALDAEVRALCERALGCLRDQGAEVREVNEPFENAGPTWRVLQQMNWAGRFGMPDEASAALMDPGFVAGVKAAHALGGMDLARAQYKRSTYFRLVQAWFEQFDWVATPVTSVAGVPLEAGGEARLEINGEPAGEVRSAWAPYLNLFNFSGHPALSVPVGWTRSGMPVGLQLVGRLYADARLLGLAALLEAAFPWAERRPPHAP